MDIWKCDKLISIQDFYRRDDLAYVANEFEDTVAVIDMIPSGPCPVCIAIRPL